jgi:hypothetical protein
LRWKGSDRRRRGRWEKSDRKVARSGRGKTERASSHKRSQELQAWLHPGAHLEPASLSPRFSLLCTQGLNQEHRLPSLSWLSNEREREREGGREGGREGERERDSTAHGHYPLLAITQGCLVLAGSGGHPSVNLSGSSMARSASRRFPAAPHVHSL